MDTLWVYWKDQCLYCMNREKCEYKNTVIDYIQRLREFEKNYFTICCGQNIYGTTDFWCDYYIVDEEEYLKRQPADCCG